jgi:hypothetical protein
MMEFIESPIGMGTPVAEIDIVSDQAGCIFNAGLCQK